MKRFVGPLTIYLVSRIIVLLVVILVNAHDFGGMARLDQWDAKSYLSVATDGYQFHGTYVEEGTFIAFFPLYPLAVNAFHWLTHLNVLASGYVLSFLFGAVAVCLLYEYIRTFDYPHETALAATALLSFFPSSVFLSSLYTEGLFLVLALGVLLALHRHALHTATLLTGLALVTRMTGIVLVPILAWHVWQQRRSLAYLFVSLALAAIPLLIFLGFQWDTYGTPFAFLKAQEINWGHHATWPWKGAWTIVHSAFSDSSSWLSAMWRGDTVMLVAIGGMLVASRRHVPKAMFAFGCGAYILTLSQSYILGTPRYMMMVLPYFLYGAYLMKRSAIVQYALVSLSAGWMVFNTILFSLSKPFF